MTQSAALAILKTGANVFLTGKPGSGKTHTVNAYVAYLRTLGVEPAITASTGIAATHIGGLTIHSWSGIGIKTRLDKYELDKLGSSEYLAKRIGRAKVLIIDEVSMLSAGTLGMVDAVCREVRQSEEAFGGLQVVLVGDFFQLPPIVRLNEIDPEAGGIGRFACESPAWTKALPIICYLTEQHRQDDGDFVALLSAIRQNTFAAKHLQQIKKRKITPEAAPPNVPKLFSHNLDVDRVNDATLMKLASPVKTFVRSSRGPANLVETLGRGCLSPENLALKVGAVVMFTKNNPRVGFANGTLGTVLGFSKASSYPLVKTRTGVTIEVEPMEWTIEESGVVRARITQVPLRLAWAITVHKSQGMSLDEAVVDLSQVFEFGQGYVALSRVRRLTGLHLLGWNERTFQVQPEILAQDGSFRQASVEAESRFARMAPAELAKMQANFIRACGGGLGKKIIKKQIREKSLTYDETLALFKLGLSLAEIAVKRSLAVTTIMTHIEKLFIAGKISSTEIEKIIPARIQTARPEIEREFKKSSDGRLAPIFEKFHGQYAYEDLRLIRLLG